MFAHEIVHCIRNQKIPGKQDQIELLKKYREHKCMRSREKLAVANIGFVAKLALQYRHPTISRDDILQKGMQGILHAMEIYDFRPEVSFLSYARYWAEAYIRAEIRDFGNFIRIPANKTRTLRDAYAKTAKPNEELTEEEQYLIGVNTPLVDLQGSINDDSNMSICETIADEQATITDSFDTNQKIKECIENNLSEIQKLVIKKLYGFDDDYKSTEPLNLKDVSVITGTSLERVRQIRDVAIRKLQTTKKAMEILEQV